MLPDEQLQELADDIRQNGLRQPIVIDNDELILDGRNRAAACIIAEVEPLFEPFTGTDEDKLKFVISCNLHRRHLDTSQRAMVGAKIEPELARLAKERQKRKPKSVVVNSPQQKSKAQDEAAKIVNVSGKSVSDAKTVLNKGTPEQIEAVETGKSKVSAVAKEIRGGKSGNSEPKVTAPRRRRSMTVEEIKDAVTRMSKDKKRRGQIREAAEICFRRMEADAQQEFAEWVLSQQQKAEG